MKLNLIRVAVDGGWNVPDTREGLCITGVEEIFPQLTGAQAATMTITRKPQRKAGEKVVDVTMSDCMAMVNIWKHGARQVVSGFLRIVAKRMGTPYETMKGKTFYVTVKTTA